jgi:hypothetical protein
VGTHAEPTKARWAKEVKDSENPHHWLEDERRPTGLLDNIPENLSSEDRSAVIITRLQQMRDS